MMLLAVMAVFSVGFLTIDTALRAGAWYAEECRRWFADRECYSGPPVGVKSAGRAAPTSAAAARPAVIDLRDDR